MFCPVCRESNALAPVKDHPGKALQRAVEVTISRVPYGWR